MARTGENIYKRKDGRWEARYIYQYDAQGKAKYHSVYGKTHKDAKQKRLLMIHKNMLGIESNSPIIKFRELAENWLNNAKLRVKESTYARYFNQIKKHIMPIFGKFQAMKISTEFVEKFIESLLRSKKDGGAELSPKTVEDILIIIKSIMKFGKCVAHIELHRIKVKKDEKRPQIMSKAVQLKFHEHLTKVYDKVKAGILLSLHTGIRIGELCAVQWCDIDLEDQILHINKTLQRLQIISEDKFGKKTKVIILPPKSKKSIRDIHIPNFLINILKELKVDNNSFLLTGTEKYMEPRSLHNHFKRNLKKCDIGNYKFHSLRHTFATSYVEAGFDVKSLSEILGHSSVKVTLERYVHSSVSLKRGNMEKLVEMLLNSPS